MYCFSRVFCCCYLSVLSLLFYVIFVCFDLKHVFMSSRVCFACFTSLFSVLIFMFLAILCDSRIISDSSALSIMNFFCSSSVFLIKLSIKSIGSSR